MLAKHVHVQIQRDMAEVISKLVFAHEVPILKEVHGDSAITIHDSLPDAEPVEIEAGGEYERLGRFYGDHDSGISFVERVFGRSSGKQFVKQVTEYNESNGDDGEEIEEEDEPEMTVAELKASLTDLGIEFDKKANKATLQALLDAS